MLYAILTYLFIIGSYSPYAEEMVHSLVSYNEKEEAAMEAFQNIEVSGNKGRYTVTGEARPESGEFYYLVEDGHNEFISEKKQTTKKHFPEWSPFTININIQEESFPNSGTIILYLYERNKEGKMINALPVTLEKI
ncbi:Gmad2 immunoglobulin-like domain-containing protein [Bacillus sp. S/N-304-OC-R1]|uniref:Gmad2 immunoglobulin-like domain-containing protein n=1 Tax=Bacillus sp. S/N-304-OC-R1 TaxID=2758034 RepID=UPI001C8D18C3|nr:Gmad2 immunoglobulin-like domain-containing protein [Bacillus sp. S/N-304-OC-R1]MBY0121059.1 intracellular proteinase inhibitor [Bacillus sp. S/N-304-OC-R1]